MKGIPEDCSEFFTEEIVDSIAEDYISSFPTVEDEEIFWAENKARIFRINHTVRNDAEKIYQEPPRALDRVKDIEVTSELIVEVCSRRLEAFAKYYFKHYLRKPNSEFHKFLYQTLEKETIANKTFKWAIAAPRGNSKSTVISAIYPIWCICYNIKKYIIIISDTASQAEDFLRDIKLELEFNEALKRDFPHACGKGPTWKNNEIVTNNGIKVLSLGSGNQVRGRRWGAHRPDLVICHEIGTKILDNGVWKNVEDHSTANTFIESDGYEIDLFGIPYPEVVSKDHRYWGMQKLCNKSTALNREMTFSDISWIDVKNIDKNTYIGYKIDNTVKDPKCIEEYVPIITERNKKGQVVGMESSYVEKKQDIFYDEEFWWFVGLWLGDGHSAGKYQIGITICNKENFIFNRLKNLLNKYSIKFTVVPKTGCYQVTFSWAKINRWFNSFKIKNPYEQSMKVLPSWVEKIDLEYQRFLIQGYIDADGFIDHKDKSIRITSVCYENLLSIRRILMRLGIVSSIRKGLGPRKIEIRGIPCNSKQKYDLRFKHGVSILGYSFLEAEGRYTKGRYFIEDGYLWSKVKSIKKVKNRIFVPIQTDNHEYLTDFGISHNCDDCENSEGVRSRTQRENLRYEWFNKDVLHVGGASEDSVTSFLWVGTIIGKDALLSALVDPREYPDWNSKIFSAVKSFSTSPLWQDWEKVYKDRFNNNRIKDAFTFYKEHEEEMLEGTDVLWPEGEPYYDLMVFKISDEFAFQSEKMNNPLNEAMMLLSKGDIHFENFSDSRWYDTVIGTFNFGALDPSLGKHQKRGDRSAIVTVGRDYKTGLLFVKDIYAKRIQVDAQLRKILELHKQYRYKKFAVETNQSQFVIAENLRKLLRENGEYLKIENITQHVDKKLRFEGITPLIKDGTILFDKWKYEHDSYYKYGVDQISTFTGNDTEDDVADALVMAVELAKKPNFRMIFG